MKYFSFNGRHKYYEVISTAALEWVPARKFSCGKGGFQAQYAQCI